jgi:hypothetical protein
MAAVMRLLAVRTLLRLARWLVDLATRIAPMASVMLFTRGFVWGFVAIYFW